MIECKVDKFCFEQDKPIPVNCNADKMLFSVAELWLKFLTWAKKDSRNLFFANRLWVGCSRIKFAAFRQLMES